MLQHVSGCINISFSSDYEHKAKPYVITVPLRGKSEFSIHRVAQPKVWEEACPHSIFVFIVEGKGVYVTSFHSLNYPAPPLATYK